MCGVWKKEKFRKVPSKNEVSMNDGGEKTDCGAVVEKEEAEK